MKNIKLFFIFTFLILSGLQVCQAAVVSPDKASQVARNFYQEKRMAAEPKAVYSLHTERLITLADKNTPLIYVVCFDDAGGFVIVSGDDRIKPVLGYSFSGKYSETTCHRPILTGSTITKHRYNSRFSEILLPATRSAPSGPIIAIRRVFRLNQ